MHTFTSKIIQQKEIELLYGLHMYRGKNAAVKNKIHHVILYNYESGENTQGHDSNNHFETVYYKTDNLEQINSQFEETIRLGNPE